MDADAPALVCGLFHVFLEVAGKVRAGLTRTSGGLEAQT